MTASRRFVRQRRQARRQDVADLAQGDRTDGRERRQLPQHPQHALGLGDHARRQLLERLSATHPRAATTGHSAISRQDRFGERSQGAQLFAIAHSARTRDASGSSELASRTRRSYSCSRPLRRRCQRSSRPITAASTIRSSHRHGRAQRARRDRDPTRRGRSAPPLHPRAAHPRLVHRAAGPPRRCHRPAATTGRHCRASLSGTWPSDTYSANRRADNSSSAHASSASSARPAGSGRRVPRWNHAGNAGAIERVLEDAEVGLRRAQQHRHLIERHAAPRLPASGGARSRSLRGLHRARRTSRRIRPAHPTGGVSSANRYCCRRCSAVGARHGCPASQIRVRQGPGVARWHRDDQPEPLR